MTQNESNTQSPVTAGDKSKGAEWIVDHAEDYGFTWSYGPIAQGIGPAKIVLREDAPWIDVTADTLAVFVATFGSKLISDALRGTSIKVQTDRVNRDALKKDRKVPNRALQVKQVNSILLAIRAPGWGGTKYVVAGQTFTNEAEAKRFAENAERIKALESAQAFLAMAAENGIDPKVARDMAKAQWPLAFAVTEEQDEDEQDEQE